MDGSELGENDLTAAIAGVNTRSRAPAMTCTVEGQPVRLPPPPLIVHSGPQASMAVHGRPALLTKSPTIHELSPCAALLPLPAPTSMPSAMGVFLGVRSDLGVSMPWGYRQPACTTPPLLRHSPQSLPYPLELAHQANSYGRLPSCRDRWRLVAHVDDTYTALELARQVSPPTAGERTWSSRGRGRPHHTLLPSSHTRPTAWALNLSSSCGGCADASLGGQFGQSYPPLRRCPREGIQPQSSPPRETTDSVRRGVRREPPNPERSPRNPRSVAARPGRPDGDTPHSALAAGGEPQRHVAPTDKGAFVHRPIPNLTRQLAPRHAECTCARHG